MSEYENILKLMEDEYMEKSGCMPDEASDIGIRLKVLAKELANLSSKVSEVKVQSFPQTATGEFLDLHAKQKGLNRKIGSQSVGNIIFKRDTPACSDIIISKGTEVLTSGENPIQFQTSEECVLKKGEVQVSCKGICNRYGKVGNVAKNIICNMATGINGIISVGNDIFTGGTEQETDEDLRNRLLSSYALISNGTNRGFYKEFALKYDGINFAKVIPRKNGSGTVHIYLGSKNKSLGVSKDVIAKFLSDINEFKEINVSVTADNANIINVTLHCEILPSNGFDFEQVKEKTKNKMLEYISKIRIGQPLYVAELMGEIMSLEEVKNAKIISPHEDVKVSDDQLIDAGGLNILPMEVVYK